MTGISCTKNENFMTPSSLCYVFCKASSKASANSLRCPDGSLSPLQSSGPEDAAGFLALNFGRNWYGMNPIALGRVPRLCASYYLYKQSACDRRGEVDSATGLGNTRNIGGSCRIDSSLSWSLDFSSLTFHFLALLAA
jgi:hypothetical protein